MHAKYANGRIEMFVNTKEMPIVRKQVKPIADQEEFESRKLWKEVTAALKEQNVQLATAGKSLIEQRQRDLVKERAEKGIKWKNRVSLIFSFYRLRFTNLCFLSYKGFSSYE